MGETGNARSFRLHAWASSRDDEQGHGCFLVGKALDLSQHQHRRKLRKNFIVPVSQTHQPCSHMMNCFCLFPKHLHFSEKIREERFVTEKTFLETDFFISILLRYISVRSSCMTSTNDDWTLFRRGKLLASRIYLPLYVLHEPLSTEISRWPHTPQLI